jgi:hypothetical protein
VRFVVLTTAPPDYSARGEARLLRSGRSELTPVFRTPHLLIYAVPRPRPIVTGTAPAAVLGLTGTRLVVELSRPGDYRLAVRYSPYWHADGACLIRRKDGMTTIAARHAGRLELSFRINATSALAAVGGSSRTCDMH